MSIVGGLDIHRKQITFDYLDTATGEVKRGQITPAGRKHVRAWLARFAGRGEVAFALEGCTGWRYLAEELAAAGLEAHLGEPADTAAAGPQAARQDRQDRRPAPQGAAGRGPAARMLDPAGAHPGVPGAAGDLPRPAGRAHRPGAAVRCSSTRARPGWARMLCAPSRAWPGCGPPRPRTCRRPGQRQVATAVDMLAATEAQLGPLRHQLHDAARHLTGARVLAARLYGAGPVTGWR